MPHYLDTAHDHERSGRRDARRRRLGVRASRVVGLLSAQPGFARLRNHASNAREQSRRGPVGEPWVPPRESQAAFEALSW